MSSCFARRRDKLVCDHWCGGYPTANGTAGVENVLDVLRGGIDATMRGIGVGSIHDLSPEHVIVPDGFSPPAIS